MAVFRGMFLRRRRHPVSGRTRGQGYCHCASCRTWSAGPVNAFTLVEAGGRECHQGAEHIGELHKTDRSHRKCCKNCGGHL